MRQLVKNKEVLIETLIANRDAIRAFGVSGLSIFGSSVTDTLNPKSDIDFLVEFDPQKKSYDNFMDLSFYLEDLLGRKVELVTPQSLSKYIGPYILKEAEHVAI